MEEIIYLALTLAIEVPIALLTLPKRRTQIAFVVICLNAVTHPIGWMLIAHHTDWFVVEVSVTIIEILILCFFFTEHRRQATTTAILMNLASAMIGKLL